MEYDEYRNHDALGLAELIARREVSAGEALEAAIARAEAVNPRINAIIVAMYEQARARARQPLNGPLAGVPFLLKDLHQEYEGLPTAGGCRALRSAAPAAAHAEVVRRWLDAGVVVFGKTSTPEFGAKSVTEPEAFGPTRNPWHLDRTPGGSSGGSAAAVAAGIVPAAGANDGGGSIRIPAACCGLFGLKPGRGRVPMGPLVGESLHGAATNGVVSRTVRDSAALLDAVVGPEPGAPFALPAPGRPYLEELRQAPGRLRIGFSVRSPLGTPVDQEAVAAVHAAARLLTDLGHTVEEAEPAIDGEQMANDFLQMWFANLAATIDEVKEQTGARDGDFEADTRAAASVARARGAVDYARAYRRAVNVYPRELAAFHARYDLLLTPTLSAAPVRIGHFDMPAPLHAATKAVLDAHLGVGLAYSGLVERFARQQLAWVPFTQLANLTGRPAMSVPLHWTADGLPLGVQFVAPLDGEGTLFRLAAQLEQARPWAGHRADLEATSEPAEPLTR